MSLRPSLPASMTQTPTAPAPRTSTSFRSRTIDDGSSVVFEPIQTVQQPSFVEKNLARLAAAGSTTATQMLSSFQQLVNPAAASPAPVAPPAPVVPPPPAAFTPPPPAPMLPPVAAAPMLPPLPTQNMTPAAPALPTLPATGSLPAPAQGAGQGPSGNGIPPWLALLQQMPQFGNAPTAGPMAMPQGLPFMPQSPFGQFGSFGGMGNGATPPRRNPLSLTGADPRANDMRQALLNQLMGGGMMA